MALTGKERVIVQGVAPTGGLASVGESVTTRDIADLGGGGGSITVTGGATTVADVTTMDFTSSVTVTDGGSGTAQLALNGVTFNSDPGLSNDQSFAEGGAAIFSYYAGSGSDESGSSLTLLSGSGDGVGSGGNLAVISGDGGVTGDAGTVNFQGGSGGGTSGKGASVLFAAGSATNGDAGDVVFTPGTTGGGGRAGVPIFNNIAIVDPAVTNSVWNDDGNVTFSGTVTVGAIAAVAGAATLNARSGIVTSEGLTGATTYALTLTNAFIKTTSVIQITAMNSAGLVTWPKSAACSNGSAVVTVGMAALTGTVVINFSVFN